MSNWYWRPPIILDQPLQRTLHFICVGRFFNVVKNHVQRPLSVRIGWPFLTCLTVHMICNIMPSLSLSVYVCSNVCSSIHPSLPISFSLPACKLQTHHKPYKIQLMPKRLTFFLTYNSSFVITGDVFQVPW